MVDESTFQSFYESTKQQLWLYVVKVVEDASVAGDIFQESYIRFLQHTMREKNENAMKSYLYRTATNLINDHWRKLKRERGWFGAEDEQPSVRAADPNFDLRHDVSEAFQQLTPQQRSVLWLAYVEKYEHREIAAMLKLRENSIKVLLFRAKQKLTSVFKQMGITFESVS